MSDAKPSFSFEIMDAAGYGYYRVWKERAYLLRLAAIPVFIKFACTIAIFALDLEDNILRQGLIMLPAMFAQGWVLAQFLRTLLMDERWPVILPEAPDERVIGKLLNRARGIIASVLVYVLLGLIAYSVNYGIMELMPSPQEIEQAQSAVRDMEATQDASGNSMQIQNMLIAFLTFIPTVAGIATIIWLSRFMWLYIPFAVLMPVRDYMKALSGFMPSVRLLILFFCCMAPVIFVETMLERVVINITNGAGDTGETLGYFIVLLLRSVFEVCVALVTAAGFAWAMKPILPHVKGVLNDLPKGD
ncbi:MAG TPA: hypothetical protein PKI93_01010 [Alphaproteobacteria bacterium]|nr:hypothetical protein [Alphaproteobacteria bacterium]